METLEADIMELGNNFENLEEDTGASENEISSDVSINHNIEALEAEIMAELSDIPVQPMEAEIHPQEADDISENLGEDTETPENDISSDMIRTVPAPGRALQCASVLKVISFVFRLKLSLEQELACLLHFAKMGPNSF